MKIIDNRTSYNRNQWQGLNNTHKYITIHYLGVDGQNFNLYNDGYGGHYTIAWNGDIYWSADHNAVLWQVGTAGYYTKKYPNGWDVTNYNSIGIEMCCHCTNGHWWFTEATQKACVELVQYLIKQLNIDSNHVLRHYDVVNKNCPAPYVNNEKYNSSWTWNEFKSKINSTTIYESTASTGGNYMFTCKQVQNGSTGPEVLLLQKLLKSEGFYSGNLDSAFGNQTLNSVKNYQKSKKTLTVDGICGPNTWKSLIGF